MPWASAAISIGGSLFGGKSKKKAAKKAAAAQEAAAARQEAMVREFDARTQKQTEPYRQFGEGATNKLSDYLGIDSANPEYARNESDYNNAQGEYARLLQVPVSNSNVNPYLSGLGRYQDFIAAKQAPTNNNNNSALIAVAKARLDASRAKLDGTSRTSGRSSNFGSLLKSFTEDDLNNDVVYNKGLQFGLGEGTKGLERRALATGNFDSGAALKELTRYANDYGETKADGAQQRFMGDKGFTFNSLMAGVGVGQNAVGQSSGTSSTALNGMNNSIANGGNARSAGYIARGNANSDMWGDIGGALGGIDFASLFGKRGGGVVKNYEYGGKSYDKHYA